MAPGTGHSSAAQLSRRQLRQWRPGDVQSGLIAVVLLLNWGALGATIALLPGISAGASWDVLLATVLLGLIAAPLRPLTAAFAGMLGWTGVVVGWLFTQAVLVYLVLSVTPGIRVDGFWAAFWASWVYAALVSVGLWFVTAGDQTAVLGHLLRTTRQLRRAAKGTPGGAGVVMIQIDGLSAPLAQWAIQSGNLPTLGRWIRSGSHTMTEWHVQLPATTPASQAGLLHGGSRQVPAFRWYEKDSGRLVVTNHPKDSAYVEKRLSNGRGLLADGGVSLSNVFSGDAPVSMLTMSTAGDKRRRAGPTRGVSTYLIDPYGLTRSIVLTLGEMIKEIYQAHRQRSRGIEPRVHRSASYVTLRGVTNVLLRDLNLSLVAEHMMRGAPAIYCDFVDYDEIAHHAGPTRPESLASLDGIDRTLGTLEQIAAVAPCTYDFVVLSDHGQSQGATFKQRYGMRLEDLVRGLMSADESITAAAGDDEQWGRVGTLLTEVGGERKTAGRLTRRAIREHERHVSAPDAIEGRPDLVVVASGNLGLIYFPRHAGRLTAEEIDALYPRLLSGLVEHPGIGFVMTRSKTDGPIVIGKAGSHCLTDGRIDGDDPLTAFGPHAAADLRRHDTLPHVGDIVVNSRIDEATSEVAAFEELVGCHGGLGGWQSRAVLIHPTAWSVRLPLDGADAVHHQLIHWLAQAGLRLK